MREARQSTAATYPYPVPVGSLARQHAVPAGAELEGMKAVPAIASHLPQTAAQDHERHLRQSTQSQFGYCRGALPCFSSTFGVRGPFSAESTRSSFTANFQQSPKSYVNSIDWPGSSGSVPM